MSEEGGYDRFGKESQTQKGRESLEWEKKNKGWMVIYGNVFYSVF